jgi:hypothetical protein
MLRPKQWSWDLKQWNHSHAVLRKCRSFISMEGRRKKCWVQAAWNTDSISLNRFYRRLIWGNQWFNELFAVKFSANGFREKWQRKVNSDGWYCSFINCLLYIIVYLLFVFAMLMRKYHFTVLPNLHPPANRKGIGPFCHRAPCASLQKHRYHRNCVEGAVRPRRARANLAEEFSSMGKYKNDPEQPLMREYFYVVLLLKIVRAWYFPVFCGWKIASHHLGLSQTGKLALCHF